MSIHGLIEASLIVSGLAGVFLGHYDYAAANWALAAWYRLARGD